MLLGTVTAARPDWPFPAADGTTWQYTLMREPEQDRTILTRQIVASPGSKKTRPSLRLEQRLNSELRSAQMLAQEKGAIVATSERSANGETIALKPPSIIFPAKMEVGSSWNFRGQIGGIDLVLPLKIVGTEEIQVAAGKFRAWHIRGEQNGTVATTAEEWFAPGVGWIKETVTQRSPTGQLLSRRSAELTALPSTGRTETIADARPLEASVSTSTGGTPMSVISADALQIIARWRARPGSANAKIRAVWIAEDTGGIVPPGFKIDEATAVATPPEAVGTFTLSRPADGWAAGKYRVDFYLRDALAATVRITIPPRASVAGFGRDF
jgi:hypothetical protein